MSRYCPTFSGLWRPFSWGRCSTKHAQHAKSASADARPWLGIGLDINFGPIFACVEPFDAILNCLVPYNAAGSK